MKKIIVISVLSFILLSCGIFSNSVFVENDKVMDSKRVIYEAYFTNNKRYEQSYSQNITFLKEIDRNHKITYSVYDVITLPSESFDIDPDKLYLIIDEEILPLQTTFNKQFNNRNITEKKSEIMKSDSTKVSVVTGYDVVNKKSVQMTHVFDNQTINKIRRASIVNLRYYLGASYINTEIKGGNLRKLKALINK